MFSIMLVLVVNVDIREGQIPLKSDEHVTAERSPEERFQGLF